ncbi:MAG: cell division protein FtsK [Methylococcales bacterium]|nr:cell division protein FtsK [Methylococcales bacterium]MBT7411088.1 cell division protein FtsK [Methylococcales bacterium]
MSQAIKKKSDDEIIINPLSDGIKEGFFFLFSAIAIYLFLSILTYHKSDCGWSYCDINGQTQNLGGMVGAWVSDVLLSLFGYFAYILPFLIAQLGRFLFHLEDKVDFNVIQIGLIFAGGIITLTAGTGLCHLHFEYPTLPMPGSGGGILGEIISDVFQSTFSYVGASFLLLGLFLSGFTLTTGFSWIKFTEETGRITLLGIDKIMNALSPISDYFDRLHEETEEIEVIQSKKTTSKPVAKSKAKKTAEVRQEPVIEIDSETEQLLKTPKNIEPKINLVEQSDRVEQEKQIQIFDMPTESKIPPLSLMDDVKPTNVGFSAEFLEEMSRQLEVILNDFSITAQVMDVQPGPVVTRFEIQLAPGVKVSKVTNIAKDLARALSTISVRVVEIIPGKPYIGLEIPNENKQIVYLGEVIRSKKFDKSKSPMTMALGMDISGQPAVADLAKMPHLLAAGTTGSGKSVAVNAMILSLLYKSGPKDVRLIMIDPKMLELSVYDGIPHLLCPVVTDMKEAANSLKWAVAEMDRRYKLMAALGVRNIAGFNTKVEAGIKNDEPLRDPLFVQDPGAGKMQAELLEKLPYIVIIIDELADMMMIVGKKVEELIARLAQKARASGIHLILATQRPSVDVITGLIKANIPSRIAFQVSSKIDSRTIIDQMGAEALLGHGDMLYLPSGAPMPVRIHGAFVDDHEVHKVVNFLKQTGEPDYLEEIGQEIPDESDGSGDAGAGGGGETDQLYDQAVKIVTESRRASISGVQRRLKIGYNRAARLIEEMEAAGIVSSPESNGQREVLAPPPPKD